MSGIGFLSLVTAPIEVLGSDDVVLSNATGFFYKREGNSVLFVTNWHVVTGRHPTSPNISSNGAVPTKLRMKVHKKIGDGSKIFHLKILLWENTINDELGNKPEWLEHPQHKFKVDLVVLKLELEDFDDQVLCNFLSEYNGFHEDYYPSAMDDIFVLGYPWGLTGGNPVLPLYKRGSVASEPVIDQEGLPRFLIDCRTAYAMSGSPVICRNRGFWNPDGSSGDFGKTIMDPVENFVGVYSGRLIMRNAPEENVVQSDRISEIGVVWKKTALDEIVENGVTGTTLDEL